MHPELLRIGNFAIYSYGFMMALGIISAVLLSLYRGKQRGFNTDYITDIALYGVLGGLVGAKLLYFISEAPYIIKNPAVIKDMLTSGFVLYGAIIGGALAALVYCRIRKISFLKHFDLIAPAIAVAQGLGRIGCFFAGCCYGKETHSAFAITFKNSNYAPNNIPLYPTQLISSAGDFLIAGLLLIYASKERHDGKVAGLYMILYSIGRFLIEFLRDDPRGNVGILSTSQFICIFVLIGGFIIYNMNRMKSPASHD